MALAFVATGLTPAQRRVGMACFVAISLATLFLLRAPSLFLNFPLNPDEAQFTASAIKLHQNLNTWSSVDTMSSGPGNIFALMWPFLFQADATFFSTRLTALIIHSATWLVLWTGLKPVASPIRLCVASTPIILLGASQDVDLLHYSSELVPSFLLLLALVVTLSSFERALSLVYACLAAFCLGIVPFAKLQATFVALLIGLLLLWRVAKRPARPIVSVLALLAAASLPAALILLPLGLSGLQDFWISYIGFATDYVRTGWPGMQGDQRLPGLVVFTTNRIVLVFILVWVVFAVMSTVLVRLVPSRAEGPHVALGEMKAAPASKVLVALAVLVAAVAAVFSPGRSFVHYAILIVWPLSIMVGLEASRTYARLRPVGQVILDSCAAFAVMALLGLSYLEHQVHLSFRVVAPERLFRANDRLISPDGGTKRMLVWGWMPELFVWSGMIPATRDTITFNEIAPTPHRAYYRARLMSELQDRPPEYIVDAVSSSESLFQNIPDQGIGSFPELKALVSARYVSVGTETPQANCPVVYALKEVAAKLATRFIRPDRVRSSPVTSVPPAAGSGDAAAAVNGPEHVIDGIVFEACSDAWLPPSGAKAEIALELDRPQEVAAIEILNTRGEAKLDRATETARVMAYQGTELRLDQTIQVLRFPSVTQVDVPKEAASLDKIVVQITEFAGSGGGLNEIRLRRR